MNPVSWFEIYVDDMERAKAFYEAVFQVQLTKLPEPEGVTFEEKIEMYAFEMHDGKPGASGAIVKMDGMPAGGSNTLVYLSCNDCSIECGRVVENGGSVLKEKFSIGQYGFISIVSDTENNVIGLHSEA